MISAAREGSGGLASEVGLHPRWPSGAGFAVFVAAVLGAAVTLFGRRDA